MANPQNEPTMEEILASIRKIISEDSPAPQAAAAVPSENGGGEPEVLDLTVEVHDLHESSTSVSSANSSSFDAKPADEQPIQPVEEASVSSQTQAPAHSSGGIFSEQTRKALNEAFAGVSEPVAPVSGVPLEALFQRAIRQAFDPVLQKWLTDSTDTIVERMKPTIREWLDENFPAMLEEAVRAELARAVKARGSRHR